LAFGLGFGLGFGFVKVATAGRSGAGRVVVGLDTGTVGEIGAMPLVLGTILRPAA